MTTLGSELEKEFPGIEINTITRGQDRTRVVLRDLAGHSEREIEQWLDNRISGLFELETPRSAFQMSDKAKRILEGEDPRELLSEGGAATKMGRDAGRSVQNMSDQEIAQTLAQNMDQMDQDEAKAMAQTLAQRLNRSDSDQNPVSNPRNTRQNPVSNPDNTQEQDDDMNEEEPEDEEEPEEPEDDEDDGE